MVGGGVAVGATLMRAFLRSRKNLQLPAMPACGKGSVWSDSAQRCIAAPTPEKPPRAPSTPPAEDDWGTGMQASTQATMEGLAVRLFRDAKGAWNFGYSWRPDRASGEIAAYLADDPDEDTVIVLSHLPTAEQAYMDATNWVENRLVPFAKQHGIPSQVPPSTVAPGPIVWEGDRVDHWAMVAPNLRPMEGKSGMAFWDYEEPEYFAVTRNGSTTVGGCCYDHNEAWREALRYY